MKRVTSVLILLLCSACSMNSSTTIKFPNKTAGDTIILLALSYYPIHKNEMALTILYAQPFKLD